MSGTEQKQRDDTETAADLLGRVRWILERSAEHADDGIDYAEVHEMIGELETLLGDEVVDADVERVLPPIPSVRVRKTA